MTIRNLEALFRPSSVALIGASDRPCSAGLATMQNLLAGGFGGPVFPVNPAHRSVSGVLCYPDISQLPLAPELAVICTPPATVPGLIADLGRRGTKAAVVITAGFAELGDAAGRALTTDMLQAARPHGLRIIGPNCIGVISTPAGLNASFAPNRPAKGGLALVAQSGGILTSLLDWGSARGIGFSHLVSLGDMADVDFGDMLDWLASDAATSAVLLYAEAVTAPRKFLSAARAAARLKPVIAMKPGRHAAAARAASSHTGAMAGTDAVYDAAFRRAGIVRVIELEELLDAAGILSNPPCFTGGGITILTNGGGPGVIATDAVLDAGENLTPLSADAIARLNAVLPPAWSHANPVDIIGDAPPARYAAALEVLLSAPETGTVLVINVPTAVASTVDAAAAVAKTCEERRRTVLASFLSPHHAAETTAIFAKAGIPAFDTPSDAVRGFAYLQRYRKGQEVILEAPAAAAGGFDTDIAGAQTLVSAALESGVSWLSPADCVRVLAACGIPAVRGEIAATPADAAAIAARFATPVALKIVSPDIQHKTDIGGVVLGLADAQTVRQAAADMLARVEARVPRARVEGLLVQEMAHRSDAHELICGMSVDRQFGPVLLFGQGGTAAEIIADRALALPPLNQRLANELIERTRVFRQLQGYRDRPAAALDQIALTLVKLSRLICELDEVAEIDINPLLADASGVLAADVKIRVAPFTGPRGARLAIRPYPAGLSADTSLPEIGRVCMRAIRPEDAPAFAGLIHSLTETDARLRFFSTVRDLATEALARFTQIDYDREMGFVVFPETDPESMIAAANLISDPDHTAAEFAIVVRSGLHHQGAGRWLMQQLILYARKTGLQQITGMVLAENHAMLNLCSGLGFVSEYEADSGVTKVRLRLGDA